MHYKDNRRRFFWARIGVLVFWAGSLSFFVVFGIMLFMATVFKDLRMLEHKDFYATLIILLTGLGRIIGGVLVVLWMRRAYYNLEVLGAPTEFSDGWAVGAWFIPLLNLVRPYQIMRELIRKYERTLGEEEVQKAIIDREGEAFHFPRLPNAELVVWWITWISTFVIGRIILVFNDLTFSNSLLLAFLGVVSLYIVAVSVSALLLLKIMKHQHHIAKLLISANDSKKA